MKKFHVFLILFILVLIVSLILSSSYFTVKQVLINGNLRVLGETVKETCNLNKAVNIFAFNSLSARKNLLVNPYVKDVSIDKKFPDTIVVEISERRLSGYIEYLKGTFLYIDDAGMVLDVRTYYTEKLPIVVGLKFSDVAVGRVLEVENKNAFATVMKLSLLFNKYAIEDEVIRIDVSDDSDIHVYVYNIDVRFGDISDADQKVRTLIAILDKLPDAQTKKGFIDMRNVSKQPPIFKLLS